MPSIGSILSTAAGALRASQAAINVSANNLSNASVEGYSRQVADLRPNAPAITPEGVFGTGVSVQNVTRIRDSFLDRTYWRENASAGQADVRQQLMTRIETSLAEPGSQGITASLDRFFNAWSELATNPTDGTVRTLVRRAGSDLAATIGRVAGDLGGIRTEAQDRLLSGVERINALTESLASVNRELVAQETSGLQSPGLRDQRDALIDELSNLVHVDVAFRSNGSVGVSLQGITIVDGPDRVAVEDRVVGGDVVLGIEGRGTSLARPGGQIGGQLAFLNEDLAEARAVLDDLAAAMVADVNAIHATGTAPDGTTGNDFFDPAGVTAGTIALAAGVAAGTDAIAAGTPDGSGNYRAGAVDVALSIAAWRDDASPTLGRSFGATMRGLVSDVAQAVRSSADAAEVQNALLGQIDNRRASVSGVSTDEELVALIRYQTSYQAAARVISVADELLQTLVQL